MGVDTENYSFHEIFGFDPDVLEFVPKPVLAIVALFPVTDGYEEARKKEHDAVAADPARRDFGKDSLIYSKQTISNACGTMGLLHALSNGGVHYTPGSPLDSLVKNLKPLDPYKRAEYIETCKELETAHQASLGGQTAQPALEDSVDNHYCAFVEHQGHLVELDGRKEFPIDHGPIQNSLLHDVIPVIQGWMELSPGNPNFSLAALCNAPPMD